MGKKVKAKVKTEVKKGKAVKPSMGRGSSGIIPVSLRLKVEKDKKKKKDG